MRNWKCSLLVSAILSLGIAGPALARDHGHKREHERLDWKHGQGHWILERRHAGVHDGLDATHDEAHYYNPDMSRRGHRRLHRQLDRNHAWQDDQLNWQHNEFHGRLYDRHDAYHGYDDRYGNYYPRYYSPRY